MNPSTLSQVIELLDMQPHDIFHLEDGNAILTWHLPDGRIDVLVTPDEPETIQ